MRLCMVERRVISCGTGEVVKVKGHQQQQQQHRRVSCRSVLVAVLVLGVVFLSLLSLGGAAICRSMNCLWWRYGRGTFGGSSSQELMNELKLGLLEVEKVDMELKLLETAPQSFGDLVADMSSDPHQDIKAFALKIKAMMLLLEQILNVRHSIELARLRESVSRHLASIDIPKSMHCLSLILLEEYYRNALARSPLPPPEYVSHLNNHSFVHLALLTDNVLAAAVVVSSTIKSSANPENLVFHIIADKKSYATMHSWFALNPAFSAVVEVKGLHQLEWPSHVSASIMETVKIHQITWDHSYHGTSNDKYQRLEALRPSSQSLLNHLIIHLPELFPELDKIIFLHDDVVVCRDLSPLWDLDLKGKVNGAVRTAEGKGDYCIGETFGDYLNFSNMKVSIQFDRHQCAWKDGMNIFDLNAWRRSNISETYLHWLKLNHESGFAFWRLGSSMPPALIAFEGHTYSIPPSWHLWGLGHRPPEDDELLRSSAVLHFSGPAKPWLQIGFPVLRNLWHAHVNQSNEFVKSCRDPE
ncbi:hypothetical protein Taro_005250 [Colocasia esculenta]|uniref:Hexosyltransferase n=1 Tax=Colocasia esculenta TaxID=4460 RepID=A0A843TML7_COLES|nr:hypothetical protein [Colocasia esculenta]